MHISLRYLTFNFWKIATHILKIPHCAWGKLTAALQQRVGVGEHFTNDDSPYHSPHCSVAWGVDEGDE